MPSTAPSVRAVTSPTRRPVNGPGPTPTATAVSSRRSTPASASTASIAGASSSPCRRASTVVRSASSRAPSRDATVTAGVAVSRASSTVRLSARQAWRRWAARRPPTAGRPGAARQVAGLVGDVVPPVQRDLQPVLGETLDLALTPLDDGDRLVQRGVQVEVVDLGQVAEPVGVHVHQGRTAGQRRVHPRDHERRRGDRPAHPEPGPEAAGERGLARTEVSAEQHEVSGPEQSGHPAPEVLGVLGGGQRDGHRQPPLQLHPGVPRRGDVEPPTQPAGLHVDERLRYAGPQPVVPTPPRHVLGAEQQPARQPLPAFQGVDGDPAQPEVAVALREPRRSQQPARPVPQHQPAVGRQLLLDVRNGLAQPQWLRLDLGVRREHRAGEQQHVTGVRRRRRQQHPLRRAGHEPPASASTRATSPRSSRSAASGAPRGPNRIAADGW